MDIDRLGLGSLTGVLRSSRQDIGRTLQNAAGYIRRSRDIRNIEDVPDLI